VPACVALLPPRQSAAACPTACLACSRRTRMTRHRTPSLPIDRTACSGRRRTLRPARCIHRTKRISVFAFCSRTLRVEHKPCQTASPETSRRLRWRTITMRTEPFSRTISTGAFFAARIACAGSRRNSCSEILSRSLTSPSCSSTIESPTHVATWAVRSARALHRTPVPEQPRAPRSQAGGFFFVRIAQPTPRRSPRRWGSRASSARAVFEMLAFMHGFGA